MVKSILSESTVLPLALRKNEGLGHILRELKVDLEIICLKLSSRILVFWSVQSAVFH